jgi:hypothetical protein
MIEPVAIPVLRSTPEKNRGSELTSSTFSARPLRSTAPAIPRSAGNRSPVRRLATSGSSSETYGRLLGIEVAHHCGRIFDIRKQRRDRLALALDDGLRISFGREANCQGLCFRGVEPAGRCAWRRGTFATEFRSWSVLESALRALPLEGRRAFIAEFQPFWIFRSAVRAAHIPPTKA